jgi:hypothetical protein
MAHTARLLLTAALLGGISALPETRAQGPAPRTAPESPAPAPQPDVAQLVGELPAPLPGSDALAPDSSWQPEFLRSLPHPPDQPASLFEPAPPITPSPKLEQYFVHDLVLDPPQWPKTGWFSDLTLDIIHPHVFGNQWHANVLTSAGRSVNVTPGVARLDWTVAPRLELGYRLTSGFGEFAVSDRGFYTDGTGPFSGPAGNFTRTSHLGVNYTDMDYASREYTQWPNWTLKWRAGVRVAYAWIDTTVSQPFNVAAAGNGVFADRATNSSTSAGPHFGVLLDHNFAQPGFSFISNFDIATTFARIRQKFATATTTLTPAGEPARGQFIENFWNTVPILNFRVGLGYQPPDHPNIHLYTGYVYEFWWQVGTESNTGRSHMFFDNQGITISASLDF